MVNDILFNDSSENIDPPPQKIISLPLDPARIARDLRQSFGRFSGKLTVRYSIIWSTGSLLNTRKDALSPEGVSIKTSLRKIKLKKIMQQSGTG